MRRGPSPASRPTKTVDEAARFAKMLGRAFLEIEVVRVGDAAIPSVGRRAAAVHADHFVRTLVQRPQQQAVDEAEHADVDADAERQGHDRREREPGTVT